MNKKTGSSNSNNISGTRNKKHPKTVQETIKWLVDVLKRPPLPECPVECQRDCQVPEGKAPAYLNGNGKAHLVKWTPYQERMPRLDEIRSWFSKTDGIGTLGGWNGQHYIGFVDLDHKAEVFESYEAFRGIYENWMDSYPILKTAPRFKTPGGGYRVILAFTEAQDWVAFTLVEGMPRMGELLQKNGSHTLLPPSVSVEGKPYQWEHFTEYPPVVNTPQEVGIYPTRKNHSSANNDRPLRKASGYTPGALRLEDLGSDKARAVLNGEDIAGDRSESLTVAAREWYGWENFCRKNGLIYNGTTEELAAYAWSRLDDGNDSDKWERILKTVDPDSHTAAEHMGGDVSCWKKIKRLAPDVWQEKFEKKRSVVATSNQITTLSNPVIEPNTKTVVSVGDLEKRVETIVQSEKPEWLEIEELVKLQSASEMSKEAFWELVKHKRSIRELRHDLEQAPKNLNRPVFEWSAVPSELLRLFDLLSRDADKRNIDPVTLLAYLLPVCGSLLPRSTKVVFGGTPFPFTLWSCLLMESGAGKSRAESLIASPLRAMQSEITQKWEEETKEQKKIIAKAKAACKKTGEAFIEDDYPLPGKEQMLFEVSTIPGILFNLSKSPGRSGSVWLRDEMAGIFKSLGQFSKGDNEDREILLSFWDDRDLLKIDRVDVTRSLEIKDPAMSIAGGLQPGKFREVFKNTDDADGLAARFLFFYPQKIIDRHKKGETQSGVMLRSLYNELKRFGASKVYANDEAYEVWREFTYQETLLGEKSKHQSQALQVWSAKALPMLGRIAGVVHAMQCALNPGKDPTEITIDSLNFAIEIFKYCRQSYQFMLNQGLDSNDVQSILTKLMDKAHVMDGITAREATQYVGAIGRIAKELRRTPTAYALDLFSQLVEMGKGSVQQVGKTKKFVPSLYTTTATTDRESFVAQGLGGVVSHYAVATTLQKSENLTNEQPSHTPADVTGSIAVSSGERREDNRVGDASLPGNSSVGIPEATGARGEGMGTVSPTESGKASEGSRNGHRRDAGQDTSGENSIKKVQTGNLPGSKENAERSPEAEEATGGNSANQSTEPVLTVGQKAIDQRNGKTVKITGIDGEWVDFDGEGISGTTHYSNLAPLPDTTG